eukprot:TRINITY_DN19360_c0_g2_i3.p1 TRINITY_DN19360_c0_g2~~TRINITY_DN19360_c0_g2_i3.p1  ORF type:complete len:1025 (+),score=287.34 TRINITY_DN19360_c0_g2_i3:74-3148(+)
MAPACSRLLRGGLGSRLLAVGQRGVRRAGTSTSTLSGANARYLESMYGQWKAAPASLPKAWSEYFEALERGGGGARAPAAPLAIGGGGGAGLATTGSSAVASQLGGLQNMIRAYQSKGHQAANLDPLGLHEWRTFFPNDVSDLDAKNHGFSEADRERAMDVTFGGLKHGATLKQIEEAVRSVYCGQLGFEFMHISEVEKREWLRTRIESPDFLPNDKATLLAMYKRIAEVDGFEAFLNSKYKTTKRFGVDGGESAIAGIDYAIEHAVGMGAKEVIIGMPHRGRLNMLANVVGKPLTQMFAEFKGTHYDFDELMEAIDHEDWSFAGDVKYHLGTSNAKSFSNGKEAKLTLECNPSHLETVNTVCLGRTRAKQYYAGNTPETRREVMPVLFHGDASFSGQGVCYETMQLAHVKEFDTGGTIHVVINNQIGFTTDPIDDRSTMYCTDLGKGFGVPIIHCNGDDPVSVLTAFKLAAEWRMTWGSDVILDVICYRRYGHNETLNPDYTQPQLYQQIAKHPRIEEVMREKLLQSGTCTVQELDGIKDAIWKRFEDSFVAADSYDGKAIEWVATNWEGFMNPTQAGTAQPTGLPVDHLRKIGAGLCKTPEGFNVHRGLARQLKKKQEDLDAGTEIDWATAEALAYGSLLVEGKHVRITGQDVQSGTFAHRHCVIRDQKTGAEYCFLNNLNMGPQENFIARNSILAEYAVLGFELGYTYENPHALVIWEAQFGDFANTAQVMIDQFISAGEHKWLQQSGLVMLLPHGFEGQGAEHSSARIERFLQLCDDDEDDIPEFAKDFGKSQAQKANWCVINPTTPANVYHAFRRQVLRDFRKPLVVASTKSLFRHKSCKSSLEEMGPGTRFQRLLTERDEEIANNPDKVDRLVFCSGKIYYELVAERERLGLKNVAIETLEQVAPFPFDRVKTSLEKYKNVDLGDGVHPGNLVWCQEEPKNMGPWFYTKPRLVTTCREGLEKDVVVRYVGRRAAASPATGYAKVHQAEQEALIKEALLGHEDANWSVQRPSGLLGHQT